MHLPWFLLPHPREQRPSWSQWLWIQTTVSLPPGPLLMAGFSLQILKSPGYSALRVIVFSASLERKLSIIPFTPLTLMYPLSPSLSAHSVFLLLIHSLSAGAFVSPHSYFALPSSLRQNLPYILHYTLIQRYLFIQSPRGNTKYIPVS